MKRFMLLIALAFYMHLPQFAHATGSTEQYLQPIPKIRLSPVHIFVTCGYSIPAKWNAGVMCTATQGRNINLMVGGYAFGPYDKFINAEDPKPNLTIWGIAVGAACANWHSVWKGTGLDVTFGAGNYDHGELNVPWHYGCDAIVSHALYTDRAGNYACSIYVECTRTYVVSNSDARGLAFSSSQKGSWIVSTGIQLSF